MIYRAVILFFCLALVTPARADIRRVSLEFEGQSRSYLLYVPDRPTAGPRPLVLVLHGGGGSAREVRASTRRGFETLAEMQGFYVAYPDAIGRIWDTGVGDISARLDPRRDDLGFLRALIEQVAAEVPVDRARIFATGVSRGGQASYMLACQTEGLIRAIAPVAMTFPVAQMAACPSRTPVGFLLIMGTEDPIVPYDGGRITIFGKSRDRVLSADQTFRAFLTRNGCAGVKTLAPAGAVVRQAGQGCASPTGFDSVSGGGHGWPGGRKLLGTKRSGTINTNISAPEEIWAFFSQF